MGSEVPIIEIPEAYHHIMLDQPLGTMSALRTLLETWGRADEIPDPDVSQLLAR